MTGVTELVRIHRSPTGLEPGAGAGRGAWLCREHPVACLDRTVRKRGLARALHIPVGNDEIEQLRARLDAGDLAANGTVPFTRTGRSV